MRQLLEALARIPVIGQGIARARLRRGRRLTAASLRDRLAATDSRRIIVGAGGTAQPGWISTEMDVLDLLKPADWAEFFTPGSLDAILAEHVWEHLTETDGGLAAATCYRFLKPGGYVRVAVPDGLHPDPEYRERVRPGGTGPGADDHKVLYTCRTFSRLFEQAGFQVELLEYFDEAGQFHGRDWKPATGRIDRSKRFDERNADGVLRYTSIVLDALKPRDGQVDA